MPWGETYYPKADLSGTYADLPPTGYTGPPPGSITPDIARRYATVTPPASPKVAGTADASAKKGGWGETFYPAAATTGTGASAADSGEVRAELPWYVRWPEEAARVGAFGVGEGVGALGGGTVGAGIGAVTSPVTGPVGPVAGAVAGGYAGGRVGAGIASTLMDAAIAKINQKFYDRPADFSYDALKDDAEMNMLASAIGVPVGALVDAAGASSLRRMQSQRELYEGAAEQSGKATEVGAKATAAEEKKQIEERFAMSQQVQASKAKHEGVKADAEREAAEQTQKLHDQAAANLTKEQTAAASERETEQKALESSRERTKGKYEAAIRKQAPALRVGAMQRSTGITPEATEAARLAPSEVTEEGITVPGQQFVERRVKFYDTAFAPYHQVASAMDTAYKKLYGDSLEVVPPEDMLGAEVADQQAYQQAVSARGEGAGVFSASGARLLSDAENLAANAKVGAGVEKPIERMSDWEAIAAYKDAKEANRYLKGTPDAMRLQGQLARRALAQAEKGFGAPVTTEVEPATIRRYLKLRSDARALLASPSSSGTDKQLAVGLIDGVDKTLAKSGVPGSEALDARYRTFKTLFNKDYFRSISSTAEPIDAAPKFFTNPQRLRLLWDNANPEQRQYMRKLYGHMVNQTKGEGVNLTDHKEFLAKAFPGTILAKPEAWIHLDPKLERFSAAVTDTPQVQQRFLNDVNAGVRDNLAKEQREAAIKIRDSAIAEAKKFGPAGQQILRDIASTNDPIKQAEIGSRAITGMTPQEAVEQLAATQAPPPAAGTHAIMGMQQPTQGATGKPLMTGRSPADVGINAVQAGMKAKPPPGSFKAEWVKRKWGIYTTMIGVSALLGHTASPYIYGMAAFGAGLAAKDGVKKVLTDRFVKMLADNPQEAARFFSMAGTYGTKESWRYLTDQTAKDVVERALSSAAARYPLAEPLEQEEKPPASLPPKPVKPAAKASLRTNLSKPDKKPPDVTSDLRHGFLKPHDVYAELRRKPGDMTA